MNQLSELYHIRKVFVYYLIYLVQNVSVLSYWLVRIVLNAKYERERENLKLASTTVAAASLSDVASSTAYVCYATIIYFCIVLFTIFGLVLKFLHLHILRKRFRRMYS